MDDKVKVKPTWGLAWGLFWRIFLINMGISVVIGLIMFLVGVSFMPWAALFGGAGL
jgi:uncharacterized membrane protein